MAKENLINEVSQSFNYPSGWSDVHTWKLFKTNCGCKGCTWDKQGVVIEYTQEGKEPIAVPILWSKLEELLTLKAQKTH